MNVNKKYKNTKHVMNAFITVVDKMYDFFKLFVTHNMEVENFDRT